MEDIQVERSSAVLGYASKARWAVNIHFVLLGAAGALLTWGLKDPWLLIGALKAESIHIQAFSVLILGVALFYPGYWVKRHQDMLEIGHSPSEGEEISEEDVRWCRKQARRISYSVISFLSGAPVVYLLSLLILWE